MGLALEGIKVVDVSQVAAVPMAARHLADFGADVIHVEPPLTGDSWRAFQPGAPISEVNPGQIDNTDYIDYNWENYNRNKRGVVIDLSQEKGQQIYQLLGEAIVLCSSEGKSDKFYNIWDAAQESPEILASNLTKENIKSIGVLLPYNVFDVAEIKRLYAWKGYGIKPPYVNEVKREYFWLETFRSFLPRDTNLCIIIAGYDPINSQWKVTLTDLEF